MISVVIPVYNRQEAGQRAVQSALAQTVAGHGVEVVVADDGSTPPFRIGGLERTRLVRMERNGGPAAARMQGIAASQGEYIAFLDSDDVWLPGKLAAQLDVLNLVPAARRDLTGVACGFYYPERATGRLESRMPMPADSVIELASGCWIAPGTTLVVSRRAFEIVGPLDESLRRLEDYDWLLRFGLAGGTIEVSRQCSAVIAPSGLAKSQVVVENVARLRSKYRSGDYHLAPEIARRFAAYLALEEGAAFLADHNYLIGGLSVLRSIMLKPRFQAALLPFWERSRDVPFEVEEIYRRLAMQPGLTTTATPLRGSTTGGQ